ncbi:Arsenite methyltransferase [Pyrenophora seminiperda CCB06]|uniref:Arsenite methyltransferase n=1 Tax=Pyrenophora seminiperda CCB06 TaxID=1302712 RepID=A0A3M7M447_9PLEO|nr:Arsenite methyltransferase [Pyrenophora seminiperda CCB06]
MNSISPLAKAWASLGPDLYSASSAEEKENAECLLNILFEGDAEGKNKFSERFLGTKRLTGQRELQSNKDERQTAGSEVGLSDGSNIREFVVILNTLPSGISALAILRHQVEAFFKFGPDLASFVFAKLQEFAAAGSNKLIESKFDVRLSGLDSESLSQWSSFCPWNSCKMAATLVLLFAAPRDSESLFFAVKTQSRTLGGLPTLEHIRKTPSASLDTAYRRAKQGAFGDGKRTTVMAVSLTDVHIFELAEQDKAEPHFSFSHVFVFAVGPEGTVIWQSWGKFGYRLDEYLKRGGGRLRDWQEADQFVNDFTKLVSGKGTWTAKRNKLYERLFDIDLNHICGPKGPERPLTSKFKPWVRINTLENVKYEDVTKFRWSVPFVG